MQVASALIQAPVVVMMSSPRKLRYIRVHTFKSHVVNLLSLIVWILIKRSDKFPSALSTQNDWIFVVVELVEFLQLVLLILHYF